MLSVVSAALICAAIVAYLKNINSELSNFAIIMSGIIVVSAVLEYVNEAFDFFNYVVEITGIESDIYKIVFKITAIGYLFEFAASTVEDFGMKSIATKLIFAGKIIILVTALPIVYAVLNLFVGILK